MSKAKSDDKNPKINFPNILLIRSTVFEDVIKSKEYADLINKNANMLFYKFSQDLEGIFLINI